jgi:hypothetical protein
MREEHFAPLLHFVLPMSEDYNKHISDPVNGSEIIIGLSDKDMLGNRAYDKHIRLSIGDTTIIMPPHCARSIGESMIEWARRAIR